MAKETQNSQYIINSVVRATDLLRLLARENQGMRIGDLTKDLGLDRTTIYRLVVTLEECGFLERDPKTREYHLGIGTFEVGSAYLRKTDLHALARPVMAELAASVQEAAHWAVLNGDEVICMDKVDSPRGIGSTARAGRISQINAGSVGKVLLAFQPQDIREQLMSTMPLGRFTESTISTVPELRREIESIREKRYSISFGEGEIDMACAAAPIFDHSGTIIAGLSVGGPKQRFSEVNRVDLIVAEVVAAARKISERLGYDAALILPE